MNRNWTKRPFTPVFRYGDDASERTPYSMGLGLDARGDMFKLPKPSNPALGSGRSAAITSADGIKPPFWNMPKSGIKKP